MGAGALVARRTYNGRKQPSPRGGAYILGEGSDGERTNMHHVARQHAGCMLCVQTARGLKVWLSSSSSHRVTVLDTR